MEFSDLNIWAIIVAWIVNCAVGGYWYSPAGFAKQWERYTGINLIKMPKDESTRALGAVVASSLLQAVTLAVVLRSIGVDGAAEGLVAGLVLWLGLVTATMVGVTLYSRRSWGYLWLNSAFFLVVMIINSIILAVWH